MESDKEEEEEFVYSAGESDDEEMNEEYVDVDWEDVNTAHLAVASPTPSHSSNHVKTRAITAANLTDADLNEDTTDLTQNLQQIDWDKVNRSLADEEQEQAVASARKRRRSFIRFTKDEKKQEKMLHETHLLLLLSTRIKWMRLSHSQLLRGLLLSLTAKSDVDFFAEMKQQSLAYSLALLVRWFNREFQLVETKKKQRTSNEEMVTESSLMNVFFARVGRDYELPLLFAALCGALQLPYRLTCALDPLQVQRGKTFESSFQQRRSKRRKAQKANSLIKRKMLLNDEDEEKEKVNKDVDSSEDTENLDRVFWLWCEVLDETSNSWIHVDVVRRLVDCPQEIEVLRGRTARFSYVISIQDDGLLVDVTSRYTMQWSKNLALRLADSWFEQVLECYNEDAVSKRRVAAVATSQPLRAEDIYKALIDEKKKLARLKLTEGMPSSIQGFRKHHFYCLERHLGQFECLHPRKVVGVFNGQSVFLREHVQPLQSALKWRRLGRVVKNEERQKPAKWLFRGDGNLDDNDDSNDTSTTTTGGSSLALFGLWQTTEYKPAPIVNGCVPKTEYGNIEIWSPVDVPYGAVHLQLSRIDTIADSLGLDYAPAVVGFEVRNGRTFPKLSGIVIAQSNEAILRAAHAENQHQLLENAIAQNQKLVLRRWKKLTKRLLLRQRLEDDYGIV